MLWRRSKRRIGELHADRSRDSSAESDSTAGGTANVRYRGDLRSAALIADMYKRSLGAIRDHRQVVIDLVKASHADTKLVAAVLVLTGQAARAGCSLKILAPPVVMDWIDASRVRQALDPYLIACASTSSS